MSKIIAVLMVIAAIVTGSWMVYTNKYLPARNQLDDLDNQLILVRQRLETKKKEKKEEDARRQKAMATAEQIRLGFFDLRNKTDQMRTADQRTVRILTGLLRLMHHSRVLLADVKLLTGSQSTITISQEPQPQASASPSSPQESPAPEETPSPTPVPTNPPSGGGPPPATITAGRIVKQAEIHAIATYGNIAYLVERIKTLPPTIKIDSYSMIQANSSNKPEYQNCLDLTMHLSISFFAS